jgi:N-acetylmuramic acid 6-phosphate etherase
MIPTERAAQRFRGLERWPPADLVDAMVEGQIAAVAAVAGCRTALVQAIEAGAARLERGGRLLYLGAGTSGRLATLDAAELPPTFGWPAERAVALMAGGSGAFVNATEGAEDDAAAAATALDAQGLTEADVVIGIAASGRTPYVAGGMAHARAAGALTIAIVNAPGVVAEAADIALVAETGAEVLAGSTRMKAGTAQKVLLTCLSTGIFVRLGYVYEGRMVEMRPSNDKLRARAVRMVAELTDTAEPQAAAALEAAGQSIKTAVVMLLRDMDAEAAEARLAARGGRLHSALEGPRTGAGGPVEGQ